MARNRSLTRLASHLGRGIRRVTTGTGRRIRAPRAAVLIFAAGTLAAATGAVLVWREAMRTPDAARTLVLAREVAGAPLALASPLAVEWEDALRSAGALPERWTELLAPVLPPPICPAGENGAALRTAILDGEAARRRNDRDGLRRAMDALSAEVGRDPALDVVARYGLARLHASIGDGASALRLVAPLFDGAMDIPFAAPGSASALIERGRVDAHAAIVAAHARALAGHAALATDRQGEAVLHYRLGINASQYAVAASLGSELSAIAPARSVRLALGDADCGSTDAEPLTTVDLRAGLIAAYAADSTFRDPARLRGEVERDARDDGDPLSPILAHARAELRRGRKPAIPEHVVWAASNLREVYRDNRMAPDPRLELTRSVLALRLASTAAWLSAVGMDEDGCGVLGPLTADHVRQWQGRAANGRAYSSDDSARAAVALRALAAQKARCVEAPAEPNAEVRSLWLRLASGRLPGTLAGAFEDRRATIERALAADAPHVEDLAAALEAAQQQLAVLRSGRLPADLPAHLDVSNTADFVDRWWRTLYVDAARALASAGREPGRLSAGLAPDFLEALNGTVRHASVAPSAVWSLGEFLPLAEAAGGRAALEYRGRYFALEQPGVAALILASVVALVVLMLLWLHINYWRYRLLTRDRFYRRELEASGRLREVRA